MKLMEKTLSALALATTMALAAGSAAASERQDTTRAARHVDQSVGGESASRGAVFADFNEEADKPAVIQVQWWGGGSSSASSAASASGSGGSAAAAAAAAAASGGAAAAAAAAAASGHY
ncbi:MAG: hypothetical protein QM820_34785 [Minicystis sp.]